MKCFWSFPNCFASLHNTVKITMTGTEHKNRLTQQLPKPLPDKEPFKHLQLMKNLLTQGELSAPKAKMSP